MDGLDGSYKAFDWFKPSKHHVVALRLEEEGNIIGCTQYLDLALKHKSLVLIGFSSRGNVQTPNIPP